MQSFRYRFFPAEGDEFEHSLWFFLGSLARNGQTIGDELVVRLGDEVECRGACPESDSLDPERHNEYAADAYRKVVAASRREPEYSIVGSLLGSGYVCGCEAPTSYALFTTFVDNDPPVTCGDCGGHVPLYRLPFPAQGKDYGPIVSWQSAYQACDRLYMESGVGERFGLRQMRDPRSPLSQEGLEICRDISAETGKPFYYYLWTSPDRPAKRCPGCGGEWREVEDFAGRFDRICEPCGLVAFGYG